MTIRRRVEKKGSISWPWVDIECITTAHQTAVMVDGSVSHAWTLAGPALLDLMYRLLATVPVEINMW